MLRIEIRGKRQRGFCEGPAADVLIQKLTLTLEELSLRPVQLLTSQGGDKYGDISGY